MAKTKTKGTNAKIKELKGIKPEKISDEKLKEVQSIINNLNRAQGEVGILETRKHVLLHQIAGTNDRLTKLQDEFQNEYGTNDINIQDGTINYPKENGQADS